MIYQFGVFLLDTDKKKLFKNDQVVKLGDKSFRLLQLLVEHSPGTVSKQMVMDTVWKGRVVTENTLYKTIGRIRSELETDGLNIESVFSEGYRIIGNIEPVDSSVQAAEHTAVQQTDVKSEPLKTRPWLWLPVGAVVLLLLFVVFNVIGTKSKPQLDLYDSVFEMRKAMSASKAAFISQINRRNELGQMLKLRFEVDESLSWERRFFTYYEQMNADERFVFDQIRAYTEGPMRSSNERLLELLNGNNQLLEVIDSAEKLRNHLIIWLNKYDKVFSQSEKMCLLYVGVEDGAPYPSEVDQQVIDWLESYESHNKSP